jgi:uncharacterized membrane protein
MNEDQILTTFFYILLFVIVFAKVLAVFIISAIKVISRKSPCWKRWLAIGIIAAILAIVLAFVIVYLWNMAGDAIEDLAQMVEYTAGRFRS